MKYYRPDTLEEATERLSTAEDAKVVAGGQSMMPLLRQDIVSPDALVDITAIDGLAAIDVDEDIVRIGALVRYTDVLEHALCDRLDLLRESIAAIGDRQVRNAGTIGGGVAHADPAQDLPPALQCYEAVATTTDGRYDLRDFFIDFYFTELPPTELVTGVEFPRPPAGAGGSFVKHARTPGGFSQAGVAVLVVPGEDGYDEVRVATCAGGPAPQRAPDAVEARLAGHPTASDVAAAGESLLDGMDLVTDIDEDDAYVEHLFRVLLKRALQRASARAEGPTIPS